MPTLAIVGKWMNDERLALLRSKAPDGWTFEIMAIDGMPVRPDLTAITIPDMQWKSAVLDAFPNLRWIHCVTAGVEALTNDTRQMAHPCILTNGSGVYGLTISEHCMGMILTLTRKLDQLTLNKQTRTWKPLVGEEVFGSTMAVFGAGDIGSHVAKRARAFGMRVLGYRRRPRPSDAEFDAVFGPEGKDDLLRAADHVVLAMPLTDETRNFLGERELSLLKPTARLYNVGRGALVDETALIAALAAGRLAGAALDVFTTEPLPADSPFWTLENVFVSPHCSPNSGPIFGRVWDLLVENMVRFEKGQPMLSRIPKEPH